VIPRGPDGAGDAAVDGELAIYATLADVRAAPSVLVRAAVPGEIAAQGAAAVRYALFSTLAAGVLLLLVLLRVLDRAVVEPIARLTRHAVRVGESDALDERLALARADEIGTLSREFDRMLERLASSRAALAESARAAGQSEVATGVLHNVGNVLNSVNVSARVLGDKLSGSRLAHLERLAQLLEERRDDLVSFVREDPRGKQLVPFLSTLTRQLADERAALGEELAGLTRGVEHIGELVAAQQAYATRATLIEPTSISALVEQALALTAHVSPAGREPRVARELGVPEKLPLDRHRVLEILVNLVQNARQALAEVREPELAVRARLADGELAVEVRDNGVGIAVENLPRLFQHGFTTKPGGHGFGLHASANAATELGGKLAGASAGTGRGASFVLRLPVAPLASGAAGERRSEPAQAAPADRAA
jgi:signal transduction histidine kinase